MTAKGEVELRRRDGGEYLRREGLGGAIVFDGVVSPVVAQRVLLKIIKVLAIIYTSTSRVNRYVIVVNLNATFIVKIQYCSSEALLADSFFPVCGNTARDCCLRRGRLEK